MPASIFQLEARGEQDEYLTGNPSVSFFKYCYRRHTNFSLEPHELVFNDHPTWGGKYHCNIARKGDLISKMYLQVHVPKLKNDDANSNAKWVKNLGYALIDKVEIEIGGQIIDSQPGEWMYIQSQLQIPREKRDGLNFMTGTKVTSDQSYVIFIPLSFWFNNHYNMALPLLGLQFHEVKVRVNLRSFQDVTYNAFQSVPIEKCSLLAEYIYLDVPERSRLQREKHEFLIEQVQKSDNNSTTTNRAIIDMVFNNPVKEMYWVVQRSDAIAEDNENRDWFNYSHNNFFNPVKYASMYVNGVERFMKLPGEYFNLVQPYQHHTNIPDNVGICCYSFALFPELHQPSGTFNFSLIDDANLNLELVPEYNTSKKEHHHADIRLYAKSYNVLVVENGASKLSYAF